MVKFAVDGTPERPATIGLGLTLAELDGLRTSEIWFPGTEVGVGPGGFVIVHGDDPRRHELEDRIGRHVCEVLVLPEAACEALRAGESLEIQLRCTRKGRPAIATVSAGIREPAPERPAPPVVYRAAWYQVAMPGLFGAFFLVLLPEMPNHHDTVEAGVLAMMAAMGLFLVGGAVDRWNQRVELDRDGIRCVRWWRPFALRFADLAGVRFVEDALGPYEVLLFDRVGNVHVLRRLYRDWDRLVASLRDPARR